MPLLVNSPYDGGQELTNIGASRITPRETYGVAPEGIRSQYQDANHRTEQLVSALNGFGQSVGQYETKQAALQEKYNDMTAESVDSLKAGNAFGGLKGLVSGIFNGGVGLTSGNGDMKRAHEAGITLGIQQINADPEIVKFLATDPTDITDWQKQYSDLVSKRVDTLMSSDPRFGDNEMLRSVFRGGLDKQATQFKSATNAAAVAKATEFARSQALRDGDANDQKNSRVHDMRALIAATATAYGADPVAAEGYHRIENPWLDPKAVAQAPKNGVPSTATGIFQITDARWDTIKSSMKADGMGDVAAKLTDRTNPEHNTIAWAYEYNKNRATAKNILGREPTTAEAYLMWQAPGLAEKMYTALRDNPNGSIVKDVFSSTTIKNNPKVFGDGSGTMGQLTGHIGDLMKSDNIYHTKTTHVSAIPETRLTQSTWNNNSTENKYRWDEFKSKPNDGSEAYVSARAVQALDQLSSFMGRKLGVGSSFRGTDHNDRVGGATHSQHLGGNALDIEIANPDEQKKAIRFLASIGITGVGVYKTHLHFDTGSDRSWTKRSDITDDDIKALKAQGSADTANGGYVRQTGYNGAPIDPIEARIREYRKYGIDPTIARGRVMDNMVNRSLEQARAGDPVGATASMSNLLTNFSNISDAERLRARTTQEEVGKIQIAQYNKDLSDKEIAAQTVKDVMFKEMMTAQQQGKEYAPDHTRFPKTEQGRKASAQFDELSLGAMPTDNVSSATLQGLTHRLDDPKHYKEMGYEGEDRPKTYDEYRQRLLKTYAGKINLKDADNLTSLWNRNRIAGPIGDQLATQSSQKAGVRVALQDSFTDNKDALAVLSNEVSNDKTTFAARVKDYTDRLTPFYEQTYSELYREAAKNAPAGSTLGYAEQQLIEKQAIEHTRIYARSMAAIITATQQGTKDASGKMIDPGKLEGARMQSISDQGNPEAVFQRAVEAAQRNGGIVTNPVSGIPRGSIFAMDGTGKVIKTPDGAYQMKTPSGEMYWLRPSDNVMTKDQLNAGSESYGAMAETQTQTSNDSRYQATVDPNKVTFDPTLSGDERMRKTIANIPFTEGRSGADLANDVTTGLKKWGAEIDARVADGEKQGFSSKLDTLISKMPEMKQMDRTIYAAKTPAAKKQATEARTARYDQLKQHYTDQYKPFYDAFIHARKLLDAAPSGQKEEAKRAYRTAMEAWQAIK